MPWLISQLSRDQVARVDAGIDDPKGNPGLLRQPEIAFRYDATGRSWYDAGDFESAIRFLKQSCDLREDDHAYACLQLAMAYGKLNQQDEGLRWLERAEDKIDKDGIENTELVDFQKLADVLIKSTGN